MSATPHIHEPFPALSRLPRGAQHTTRLGVLPTGMGPGKQASEALTRHLCKDFCPKLCADIKTNLKKPGWGGGVWSVLKACSSLQQGKVCKQPCGCSWGCRRAHETSHSTATDFWMESSLLVRPAYLSKHGLHTAHPPRATHHHALPPPSLGPCCLLEPDRALHRGGGGGLWSGPTTGAPPPQTHQAACLRDKLSLPQGTQAQRGRPSSRASLQTSPGLGTQG